MSEKNAVFNDKTINKSNLYIYKKMRQAAYTLIKYQSVKENHKVRKISHLNTLLGMMTMRPLCIKLPQMIEHAKYFDSNKTMSFKFNDKNLFIPNEVYQNMGKNQQFN